MVTACRCHEMLGQWEKAEAYIRATSERYDNSQFEWLLWCNRTGHGDIDAADNCADLFRVAGDIVCVADATTDRDLLPAPK